MLQFRADELQRIRNAVHVKQIFVVADESTLSDIYYLVQIRFGYTSAKFQRFRVRFDFMKSMAISGLRFG